MALNGRQRNRALQTNGRALRTEARSSRSISKNLRASGAIWLKALNARGNSLPKSLAIDPSGALDNSLGKLVYGRGGGNMCPLASGR